LREISTSTAITPVPPAPPAVRGLANLRSRVFLILDLRPLLGLAPVECTPASRLIIFKSAVAEDTGLLVDRGGDILAVPQDRIEAIDPASTLSGRPDDQPPPLVVGVCKLDNELLMVVDATRLAGTVARLLR
jgi:purine-binding chemotaxis protein CheW